MPIYAYKCDECLNEADHFRHVDERDHAPDCCGKSTRRLLSAPMVGISAKPFQSFACQKTGQVIDSERQRQRYMKENGYVDAGDKPPAYVIAQKKAQTAKNKRDAEKLYADIPKEVIRSIADQTAA